jgi:hypothetical protein
LILNFHGINLDVWCLETLNSSFWWFILH